MNVTIPLRLRKPALALVLTMASLYLVLLIPESDALTPKAANQKPFAWNQEKFWAALESDLKAARALGCEGLAGRIEVSIADLRQQLKAIAPERLPPEDSKFHRLETNVFSLAPMMGACAKRLPDYIELYTGLRELVKRQSEHWDMNSSEARQRIYRLLYGGRAALEEVMLQAPGEVVPAIMPGHAEPSQTPSTNILGVAIHSGDILVSRGGAATSALIARGNDYPGNFSHIALVHVDEKTRVASVIEAHIETGVAIASFADYLQDKKLRVMVLRLRADLSLLRAEPMLPHKAAARALHEASSRHIPYDFAMDYQNHEKQFCSEVASAAYQEFGVSLWMGLSQISAPGITSWLADFGAKHFETQEPSDLEYDPQLRVVAEWCNREALFKDHADNAVIDVMLEDANAGQRLDYSWYLLPLARLAKAYSQVLNIFGRPGPVPEGMSATAALRNKNFSRKHEAIKIRLLALAAEFRKQNGYPAPYWELVALARRAKTEVTSRLR